MLLAPASETVAAPASGVRPIDLRRDMRPIADLIAEAFEGELDAAGLASLRELRMLSLLGPMLYLMVPPSGELSGFFRGFVWEDNGRVVGNITIQQIDDYGRRYMIANVAVARSHRNRGIGTALVKTALSRIRDLGGEWAVLQVRKDNAAARHIYQRLGFDDVVAEITLRRSHLPQVATRPLPSAQLRLLTDDDWSEVHSLLHVAAPELARWWQPNRQAGFRRFTDSGFYRTWGLMTGQGYRIRQGLWLGPHLGGVLDVDVRPRSEHRLDVLLHPQLSEAWSSPLLAYGLLELKKQAPRPIVAMLFDYQQPAIDALTAWGFSITRTLTTMRRPVRPSSEP